MRRTRRCERPSDQTSGRFSPVFYINFLVLKAASGSVSAAGKESGKSRFRVADNWCTPGFCTPAWWLPLPRIVCVFTSIVGALPRVRERPQGAGSRSGRPRSWRTRPSYRRSRCRVRGTSVGPRSRAGAFGSVSGLPENRTKWRYYTPIEGGRERRSGVKVSEYSPNPGHGRSVLHLSPYYTFSSAARY